MLPPGPRNLKYKTTPHHKLLAPYLKHYGKMNGEDGVWDMFYHGTPGEVLKTKYFQDKRAWWHCWRPHDKKWRELVRKCNNDSEFQASMQRAFPILKDHDDCMILRKADFHAAHLPSLPAWLAAGQPAGAAAQPLRPLKRIILAQSGH